MTLSIGICFGKMSSLHEGLGEYGMLFGEHLARRAPALREQHGIELFYRLPQRLHGAFGAAVHPLHQHGLQRHCSVHLRRFDLWHTLHQHNPYRPPWLARQRLATVHDLNHLYDSDARFVAKSERRLDAIVARSDAFIAISEHTRRDLVRCYGEAKPVAVVHNGVRDLTAQAAQAPADAPAPGFLFHLSRMSSLKNADSLLAMMQHLPRHRLVLAGAKSGDSLRTQARAQALGLTNVQFLFDVSTAEKAWLLQHCGAFLFPSLAEGFGLPPVEALQFGKPVFLSTLTSLPEVGGPVAHYWPSFEPAAMAAVVDEALARWNPAADGERARQWASRFTWEACTEAHVQHYLRLLGLQA
jgi:glycosyltransferase involved in cell wall biosynthesis